VFIGKRGNKPMTSEGKYAEFIKDHCKKCKNRKTDLCEIRMIAYQGKIKPKCAYYEKEA
jgi:hypothetical protein